MVLTETKLKGCFILEPRVYNDNRGYFFESFNKAMFEKSIGISVNFIQDNESKSSKGVLRGLHFQKGDYAQSKLVRVVKGSILDVCVDIRESSKTFGQYVSIILDDKKKKQIYVPKGFAHGFLVLEDETIINYKCDNYYHQPSEGGIIYNDPTLNINWEYPTKLLELSKKDLHLPTFEEYFK